MSTSFVGRFSIGVLIVSLLASVFIPTRSTHAQTTVVYVVPGGAGVQNGQSWATAKDLQAALTAAVSGHQLWVKAGTYRPTSDPHDSAPSFVLKSGVAIYGGFAGTETLVSQRNIAANVTTLSGEIGSVDNSYHVVRAYGVDASAILDGVTITGGFADDQTYQKSGGGLYLYGESAPTLNNLIISGNWATENGGGISMIQSSHATLTNVTISDNRAENVGGGLYIVGSNPTLTNVSISGNSAFQNGGGMHIDASGPTLTDVTISDNESQLGGGMYNHFANPSLTDVTISGNSVNLEGGGIYNRTSSPILSDVIISGNTASWGGAMTSYDGTPTLSDVTISGNTAAYGAGLWNEGSNPSLTDVTITGNTASTSGGGMYNRYSIPVLTNSTISGNTANFGGGLYNGTDGDPVLSNTTISGNTARYDGGGLYNTSGNPALSNVVISGNTADRNGGAMFSEDSSMAVTNATLAGNTAGSGSGGAVYIPDSSTPIVRNSILWDNGDSPITRLASGHINIQYSIIEGGYAGTGNINLDPRFVAVVPDAPSTGGDLHLQSTSGAINAGSNAALPPTLTTDLDGLPRIAAGTVDQGAFERQTAQVITFPPIGAKTYGNPPFQLTASTTSGLPITFSGSGACSVVGTTATLTRGGTCVLTARQAGNATIDAVQVSQMLVVARAATTMSVRSSRNPSQYGQDVTFTATVASSAGTPSGYVNFKDGTTTFASAPLSNGVATVMIGNLSIDTHTIAAVYDGSAFHLPASRSLRQVVNRTATTMTLTSSVDRSVTGQSVTFTARVTGADGDTPSGEVRFVSDVGWTHLGTSTLSNGVATFTTAALSAGTHTIVATYTGSGNHEMSDHSLTLLVLHSTITTVQSTRNPSAYGQSVAFIAQVWENGGGIPTGTVSFYDGATSLGARSLSNGEVALTLSTLSGGTRTITARYNGSDVHGISTSAALSQVVNKAASTTTLTTSLDRSVVGQSVTFTARVTGAGATPTGSVTFKDGATVLATRALSNGVATFATAALGAGSHTITAVYGGSANHLTSQRSLSQLVRHASTTTVQSSRNPAAYGQAVTFTAQVTAVNGGTPTGTVTFYAGATSLGAKNLTNGRASLALATLSVGTHTITARYNGSGVHGISTSAVLSQVVNKAASTTTLTTSLDRSVVGQSVTFTARVTGVSGGTPSGSVTFKDGATVLATRALSNGVATFATAALGAGSHTITAVYGGSANHLTSQRSLSQLVRYPSTTTVQSSRNPSVFGQSVVFTARVTAASGGTPTGTVTFYDGATSLGARTLSNGQATLVLSTLSVATHSITVRYNGSGVHALSTSAVLSQVVR